MSFLQEMGIQEWRLRGRPRLVSESSLDNSLEKAPENSLESLKELQSDNGLPNQLADELKHEAATLDESGLLVRQAHQANQAEQRPEESTLGSLDGDTPALELSAEMPSFEKSDIEPTVKEPINGSISADSSNNQDGSERQSQSQPQSISTNISVPSVSEDTDQSSAVVMPKLRPAPVPYEAPPEMDLSIAEPEPSETIAPESSHHDLRLDNMPDQEAYSDDFIANQSTVFDETREYPEPSEPSEPSEPQTNPNGSDGLALALNSEDRVQDNPGSEPHSLDLSALDWRALQAMINDDQVCQSCGQRQSVLGYGDVLSDWMFIADAPTSVELQEQCLYVGRAGQLYEGILSACGLKREEVYSTTIFKCSPPEDLSLSPQCEKIIHRQIALVNPKVIITFGEFASQAILRANESFDILQKGRHNYSGTSIFVIPSHSPPHLLANPALKAELWDGLKFAMQRLL